MNLCARHRSAERRRRDGFAIVAGEFCIAGGDGRMVDCGDRPARVSSIWWIVRSGWSPSDGCEVSGLKGELDGFIIDTMTAFCDATGPDAGFIVSNERQAVRRAARNDGLVSDSGGAVRGGQARSWLHGRYCGLDRVRLGCWCLFMVPLRRPAFAARALFWQRIAFREPPMRAHIALKDLDTVFDRHVYIVHKRHGVGTTNRWQMY